jgi:sugar lactone lactonase YvrE
MKKILLAYKECAGLAARCVVLVLLVMSAPSLKAQFCPNGTTVAGGNGRGSANNQFSSPDRVVIDGSGNLYVSDRNNDRVQKFAPGSTIGVTVAGGNGRGSGPTQLNQPRGIAIDINGNLYVADRTNDRVQKFPPNSTSATTGITVAGGNGTGSAPNQFDLPLDVFIDGSGNLYVVDNANARIQKFPPNSTSATSGTTVAGGNGTGNAPNQFDGPTALFIDSSGNLYVGNANGSRVQKFPPNSTSATASTIVAGDNGSGSAPNQLSNSQAILVDGSGNLYVADNNNHRIQKFPPNSTSATSGITVAGGNGTGSAPNQLFGSSGLAFDGSGNLYVADGSNDRIQRFTPGLPTGITTQPPAGQSVCAGQTVTIPVSVSGTVNSYQWYKDGSSLGAAQQSATLSLTNVTTAQSGSYSVVVTGSCNSVTSTAFSLSVNSTVSITANPSLTITQGNSTTLTASGASSYRWSGGQTSAAISVSVAGTYSVTGTTGSCSSTTSVVVSVEALPCGSVVYVTPNGAGLQNGSSWTNALSGTALQTAINTAAGCGAQVWVGAGLYKPTTGTDRAVGLTILSGVQVYGGYAGSGPSPDARTTFPSSTTFSGDIGTLNNITDNTYNVVRFKNASANTRLDGIVITGGNANGNNSLLYNAGGGILNDGGGAGNSSNPLLVNLSLVANSADVGGGLFNRGSDGGNSSPRLQNVSIISNSASFGGGLYNNGTVQGNSSPVLINVSFIGNSAPLGGGLINDGSQGSSSPVLTNVSFRANSASNGGSVFCNFDASVSVTNGVFFDNGGANSFNGDNITIRSSLLEPSVTGYTTDPTNLTTTTSPFVSATDLQLTACSAAINAGDNAAYSTANGPGDDLAGNPRLYAGGQIDMGAYEFQGTSAILAITQQPVSSSTVATGATVTVPVGISGTPTSLQWYNGAGIVSGQTSSTLTLTNVQPTQTGSYSLVATSACNSVTTNAFSLSVLSGPMISATKTVSGSFTPGGAITYTLVLTNTGQTTQANNPGDELVDILPASLNLVSAQAVGGTALATVGTNTVTWNGSISPAGSITITIQATIQNGTAGQILSNQASLSYDSDGNETNDASALTDDPTVGGAANPTSLVVGCPVESVSLTPSSSVVCSPASIMLTASPGGSSYQFSEGASQIGGSAGNTATVSSSGSYSVTITYASGCTATAATSVTVNSLPSASLQNNGPLTCAQTSVTLTAGGGSSYSFSGPNGPITSSGNTASVSQEGVYSVTVLSGSGCSSVASTTVTSNAALAAPSLQASASSTSNQPISVTASGCGGSINWLPQGGTGQANGSIYTFTQPGNYTLTATCSVGNCTSPQAAPISLQILPGGFAITAVTMVNCQLIDEVKGGYQVQFTPQYSGTNGNPVSFSVVNEMPTTTTPAPYSLKLYTDNPVITLVANQAGNPEARFAYNWFASCQSGTDPNQAPMTSGIPNQIILVGQAYQLNLNNYFSDPDGQSLTYSATGLPAGLNVNGSFISGTPSMTGVSSVQVTALDPGGLSAQTSFQLTVNPAPTIPSGFTIVGVSTVSCEVLSPGLRRVTFTPQYGGTDSSPISFSVVNEMPTTTNPGPYSLNLYTDNPRIALTAKQGSSLASYVYNWLAVCTAPTRVGAANAEMGLQVKVLGNPIEDKSVEVEIRGVAGQAVQLNLVDLQGKVLHQQWLEEVGSLERVSVPVGTGKGILLLRVNTTQEQQQVKLLKP